MEIRRYHGHCEERLKGPDSFVQLLRLATIPRILFALRIFTLRVKINLFLLSPQILFLCVGRVNFPHFELSR